MEPGLGDFVSQIPISFVLVPIFFGVLYIAAMFIVFRRAAERRRRRREAQAGGMMPMGGMVPAGAGAVGGFAPIAMMSAPSPKPKTPPITPLPAANVPEPDLDMLTTSLLDEAERLGASTIPAAAPAMNGVGAAPLSVPVNAVEVMRLWRDVDDGGLVVQMGDQRFRSLADIQNPDLVRRLSAIVRDLTTMVSGAAATPITPLAPLPPRQVPTYTPTPSSTDESAKAGGLFGRRPSRSALPKQEDTQPAGIFAAVEEYLQQKLSMTPQFATRSIHIRPSLDHGIKIEVDGTHYDSIDEVADPAVRDFLFTLMREWEARQ
jgi:hypothetical protein